MRSRSLPGCVFLLLTAAGPAPLLLPQKAFVPVAATSSVKRRKLHVEADKNVKASPRLQKPVSRDTPGDGVAADAAEAVYCKQLEVIERKLAVLLPTMSREELSTTTCVQAKLEVSMQKPSGRLQKFNMEIGRLRRAFLERLSQSGAAA